ncbi:hypothetical protein QYF36_000733 [Acer negundo]|nr:hypothetical protein QYF36_000733 [Acer negundo]
MILLQLQLLFCPVTTTVLSNGFAQALQLELNLTLLLLMGFSLKDCRNQQRRDARRKSPSNVSWTQHNALALFVLMSNSLWYWRGFVFKVVVEKMYMRICICLVYEERVCAVGCGRDEWKGYFDGRFILVKIAETGLSKSIWKITPYKF